MTDEIEKGGAPNPFDPDSFRISGDINTVGAEKLLLRISVRKPNKSEFFRINTAPDCRLLCAIYENKEENEVFLVLPGALHFLAEDVRYVELRVCQNRRGLTFLWPVPTPGPDGRTNSWNESARDGANIAEKGWVRLVSNMSEGAYSIYRAIGSIPDPQWPEKTMAELLELAFKDGKLIDSEDYPVVKQLHGR